LYVGNKPHFLFIYKRHIHKSKNQDNTSLTNKDMTSHVVPATTSSSHSTTSPRHHHRHHHHKRHSSNSSDSDNAKRRSDNVSSDSDTKDKCCKRKKKSEPFITFRSFQFYQTWGHLFMIASMLALIVGALFDAIACFGDNNISVLYSYISTPSTPPTNALSTLVGTVKCAAVPSMNVPFSITTSTPFLSTSNIATTVNINGVLGWQQWQWVLTGLGVVGLAYVLLVISSSCSRRSNQWFAEQKRRGLKQRESLRRQEDIEAVIPPMKLTDNSGDEEADEDKVPGFCEDFPRICGICAGQLLFCFYYTRGMFNRLVLFLIFVVAVWFALVVCFYLMFAHSSTLTFNNGTSVNTNSAMIFSALPVLPECISGYIIDVTTQRVTTVVGNGQVSFTPDNTINPPIWALGIIFAGIEVVLFFILCCSPKIFCCCGGK